MFSGQETVNLPFYHKLWTYDWIKNNQCHFNVVNPLQANVPFLHPLKTSGGTKTSENIRRYKNIRKHQVVQKGNISLEWVTLT